MVSVRLAGHNVAVEALSLLGVEAEFLTPEVISAAYARISRDPRSVGELMTDAMHDVSRARRSNQAIVFDMGHASVAEHAVLNMNVEGLSRYAIEVLEQFRLCSFTEKSQRYTKLDGDVMIPDEYAGGEAEEGFRALIEEQSRLYERFYPILTRHFKSQGVKSKQASSYAKEDARYTTMLCVTGQLGLTANARNVELIVRRCAASPLAEVRELGKQIYDEAATVIPSLLKHPESTPYDRDVGGDIFAFLCGQKDGVDSWENVCSDDLPGGACRLVGVATDAEVNLASTLAFKSNPNASMRDCRDFVKAFDCQSMRGLFKTVFQKMGIHDPPPREFEHVKLGFEMCISASCFAQLKRHRMTSQTPCRYKVSDWNVIVPESFFKTGIDGEYTDFASRVNSFTVSHSTESTAAYTMLQGNTRQVLMSINLRDLYHFCRLREDNHSQWEIRRLAHEMGDMVRGRIPYAAMMLCGKDGFKARYKEVYGKQ